MQLITAVNTESKGIEISHRSRILLIGSCFAVNIGTRLQDRAFDIETNPFGILYNPLSISTALNRIADGTPFTEDSPEIFGHNGLWHSILHHSDFSCHSKEEALERMNVRLGKAHAKAGKYDIIFITLGTAYAYIRKSDMRVAGNCHKLPGNLFERRLLGIDEISDEMGRAMEHYIAMNPGTMFIFTISPIRHLRDGAHDNQKSKATLLLAVDRLMEMFPKNTSYFPAYEIVLDELRDYRFYAEDMTHPSAVAIEYIWEKFSECYFGKETNSINGRVEEIARGLGHRPFDTESEGYRRFLENLLQKIEKIKEEHPYLNLENETTRCNTLLNR